LIDIPLTVGVGVAAVTALAAPVLAALGAIAALVTECTIEVERVEETPKENQ
jgi:phage-related minor tail protein